MFVSSSDRLSTYGIVVVVVRRSESVVKGLSAPRAWPLEWRELRKFWTRADVSSAAEEEALKERGWC